MGFHPHTGVPSVHGALTHRLHAIHGYHAARSAHGAHTSCPVSKLRGERGHACASNYRKATAGQIAALVTELGTLYALWLPWRLRRSRGNNKLRGRHLQATPRATATVSQLSRLFTTHSDLLCNYTRCNTRMCSLVQ